MKSSDQTRQQRSSQRRKRNRDEFTQKQHTRHTRHHGQIKTLQTNPEANWKSSRIA